MFMLACSGAPDQLGECTAAQQSMHLTIADQVTPETESSSARSRQDAIFNLAELLVAGLVIGGILLHQSGRMPKWLRPK